MNRTIKFRGKCVDTEQWLFGNLLNVYVTNDVSNDPLPVFAIQTDGNSYSKVRNHIVDPSTVGQFTGLLAKDGKEIYEGDFIIAANGNKHVIVFGEWKYPSHIDTDEFVDHGIGFNIKGIEPFGSCVMGNGSLYEVIGNIHDNPELLK